MVVANKYKTLLSNTGLLLIGTFGSKMISFIMLPFYTTWLSIEDFGTSDIINVYSTVLVAIVSLCIAEAIFVVPAGRTHKDQQSFFTSSLLYGFVCAVVLLIFYIITYTLGEGSNSSFVLNIGYITLLSSTTIFTSIAQQFCKCISRIRVFAIAGILNTFGVAILGFLLIKPWGLEGYVASLVISNLFTFIYIIVAAGLFNYISFRLISWKYLFELLKYSTPLVPNSIIWLIVSYANRPIMEATLGMAAIGLFSLANKFPTLINTVYNNFSNSWQISVLQEYGKDGYENFYNRICIIVFIGMCLCVSLVAIIITPVIHLFFNENYYSAIDYIPWLCLSCPFMALASIVGANFSAIKKSKYFFYSSVWSAATALLLNVLLIPVMGLWGACIANVISFAIGAFSRIYYSRNIARLKCPDLYVLPISMTFLILLLQLLKAPIIVLVLIFTLEVLICVAVFKHLKISS